MRKMDALTFEVGQLRTETAQMRMDQSLADLLSYCLHILELSPICSFIDHNNMLNDLSTLYASAGLSDESKEIDDELPDIRLKKGTFESTEEFRGHAFFNVTVDGN